MCFGALFHAMRALWTNFVRDRAIESGGALHIRVNGRPIRRRAICVDPEQKEAPPAPRLHDFKTTAWIAPLR
jgi:hypothetical protein